MYCEKCGSVISNQAVYWPSCGAFVKAASAKAATPVSYATPVASTNLNGDHGNMSGKESPQTYNGNEAYIENKKKGARISGQILKWSAVIGVIGILLFYMLKGRIHKLHM